MEDPEPENYFKNNQPLLQITFSIDDLKTKSGELPKSLSDLSGSTLTQDILSRVLESVAPEDREKIESAILSSDQCQWQSGPCGSCYNTNSRYAYAINCGNGWEYGCGYCT